MREESPCIDAIHRSVYSEPEPKKDSLCAFFDKRVERGVLFFIEVVRHIIGKSSRVRGSSYPAPEAGHIEGLKRPQHGGDTVMPSGASARPQA